MRRTLRSMVVITSILALALVGLFVPSASASTTVLNPTDTGWWSSTGVHTAGNQNYCVGNDCGSGPERNYFAFNLATVPATGGMITGATLSIKNPGDGGGTVRPYDIWDVTTSQVALDATDGGSAGGIAVYTDLGAGVTFGTVTPASLATTPVVVPLNAAGITALNAARGTTMSLGGTLTGAVAPNDWMFGSSGGAATDVSLTLTIATPTKLTVKAPKSVAKGKMAKVSGKLSSTPATPACTDAQTLKVTAGTKKLTKTTATGGAYSFKVKIMKTTKVKVRYVGNANCAASKATKTIKAT